MTKTENSRTQPTKNDTINPTRRTACQYRYGSYRRWFWKRLCKSFCGVWGRVKKVLSGPGINSAGSESGTQRLAPLVTESLDSVVSCNKRPNQVEKDSMFFQSCQLTCPKNFQSPAVDDPSGAQLPEDGDAKRAKIPGPKRGVPCTESAPGRELSIPQGVGLIQQKTAFLRIYS